MPKFLKNHLFRLIMELPMQNERTMKVNKNYDECLYKSDT